MKITIITACYNSAKTIERTIQSVLGQSYRDIEYIIIDGASTDGTLDIIRKYEQDLAYWMSEPDGGTFDAMNKALTHATGDIIEFLNSDDAFCDNDVICRVCEEFENHPETAVLVGKNHNGIASSVHYPETYKSIYVDACFPHQALFAKKRVFDEIGFFDRQFHICADRDWILKAYQNGYVFRFVDDEYVNYSVGGISYGRDTCLEEYNIAMKYLTGSGNPELIDYAKKHCVDVYTDWHIKRFFSVMDQDIITSFWKDILSGDDSIVVWGRGDFGKLFTGSLMKCGFIVDTMIDSNAKGTYLGIPVVPFHVEDIENKDVIVATSRYEEEILYILEQSGIKEHKMISFNKIRRKVMACLDDEDDAISHIYVMTGIDLLKELHMRVGDMEQHEDRTRKYQENI